MSAVTVQFLGSGDAFGSGGRLQTCIHVESGSTHFLIDCGASSLIAMRRFGVSPGGIEIILITHLHGDHFGGLPFFILDAQLITRRAQPLLVAGPPGLEARTRDAMEVFFPGSSRSPQKFLVQFMELPLERETAVGPLAVTPYPVIHASGAPAYALRVRCDNKVIAYSGDTEWTDALIHTARGADLFICEAYFFDKPVKYHLDCQTLLSHREELGCRRLILTHMSADMLRRIPDIDVECAEDGKIITV